MDFIILELTSGLFVGIIFGFLLKKARFCPTGIIRDIYLEKRTSNIFLILSIIFTQSLVYYIMVKLGLITEIVYDEFSLLGIGLGSFLFGFGAIMANGCMTSSLIKTGDGRVIGFISIITFMITGYICTNGFLVNLTDTLNNITVVDDSLSSSLPISPILIVLPILCIIYIILYKNYIKFKPKFTIPKRSSGLKYIFFEKIWPLELVSILIGLFMGITYFLSEYSCSRTGSIAISSPLMSWFYTLTSTEPIISGGWNDFDQSFGWGSLQVLGIILGSFLTTYFSKEFKIVKTNKKTVIMTIIGSILMGIGATWGQGCIIGNALVGTAQFSLKAWYATIFLILGIWSSARIFLFKNYNN